MRFLDENTWTKNPDKYKNPRTGKMERTSWNKTLQMKVFASDYKILGDRENWSECPDHSFAKIITRLYPAIFIPLYHN
jgi:hypothetical protein